MSFFVAEKVKEKVVAGEVTYVEDRQNIEPPRAAPVHKENDTLFAPTVNAEEDSAGFPFDFDLQGFASVLCFLLLVALLCGWFDKWVTLNRESSMRVRAHVRVQLRQATERGPEILESFQFQAAMGGENASALTRSQPLDQGQDLDLDLDPQLTTPEVEGSARISRDVVQSGTNRNKPDGAGSTTGGEDSSRSRAGTGVTFPEPCFGS